MIDDKAAINLIIFIIIKKMSLLYYLNSSVSVKLTNGCYQKLIRYIKCLVTIAERTTLLKAYIIGAEANYSLLLSRSWIRKVKLISLYRRNQYWLTDNQDNPQMLKYINKPSKNIKLPNICLTEGIICEECRLDPAIIIDLEEEEDDDIIKGILKEVI